MVLSFFSSHLIATFTLGLVAQNFYQPSGNITANITAQTAGMHAHRERVVPLAMSTDPGISTQYRERMVPLEMSTDPEINKIDPMETLWDISTFFLFLVVLSWILHEIYFIVFYAFIDVIKQFPGRLQQRFQTRIHEIKQSLSPLYDFMLVCLHEIKQSLSPLYDFMLVCLHEIKQSLSQLYDFMLVCLHEIKHTSEIIFNNFKGYVTVPNFRCNINNIFAIFTQKKCKRCRYNLANCLVHPGEHAIFCLKKCRCCLHNQANCIIDPCGHAIYCLNCVNGPMKRRQCFHCGAPIRSVKRVLFLPAWEDCMWILWSIFFILFTIVLTGFCYCNFKA
jgi:hypothetical protein